MVCCRQPSPTPSPVVDSGSVVCHLQAQALPFVIVGVMIGQAWQHELGSQFIILKPSNAQELGPGSRFQDLGLACLQAKIP